MNIFKEMALSIYSYGSYGDFLKNRKGKVFGFSLVLMLIYFTVTILLPSATVIGTPSALAKTIRDNVPDFELKNGTLWVEETFELDRDGTYICIDTDPEYFFYDADQMKNFLYEYNQVILMDSEKMIVKNNREINTLYFKNADWEFDRNSLMEFIPWIYAIYIIAMVIAYIWMTALFFFGVLFVALIGMIVKSSMNFELTFGQLYLIGIYSRTLPLIIKAVVSFLPIHIPFFWVFNFGISVFTIAMAIQKMKEQRQDNSMGFPSNGWPV